MSEVAGPIRPRHGTLATTSDQEAPSILRRYAPSASTGIAMPQKVSEAGSAPRPAPAMFPGRDGRSGSPRRSTSSSTTTRKHQPLFSRLTAASPSVGRASALPNHQVRRHKETRWRRSQRGRTRVGFAFSPGCCPRPGRPFDDATTNAMVFRGGSRSPHCHVAGARRNHSDYVTKRPFWFSSVVVRAAQRPAQRATVD